MRQALHIFRKDVTHLWPQIALVWLIVAAFCAAAMLSNDPLRSPANELLPGFLGMVLPAACAWLIVTVAHQEPIPGDRQFWPTRPYRKWSLLAAKTGFVVLFISLPLVLKDIYLVTARGFAPEIGGLFLRQIAWNAWFVLPLLAVASLTRNLQEVGLTGAAIGLAYGLAGVALHEEYWQPTGWVRTPVAILVLIMGSAVIIALQYLRRETGRARVVLAACTLLLAVGLPALPWRAAYAVEMMIRGADSETSRLQISPGPLREHAAGQIGEAGPVLISLPVSMTGLAPNRTVVPDGVRASIRESGRELWHSGWQHVYGETALPGYREQAVYVDRNAFLNTRDRPVEVTLSLALTVMANDRPVRVGSRAAVRIGIDPL
jgi:hypothetical protein